MDTDNFVKALLTKRNTPDQLSKLSPADILFGRKLRDAMPSLPKHVTIMNNPKVLPIWREGWKAKEEALRLKYKSCMERMSRGSKLLPKLQPGDTVALQNQGGQFPNKWEKTGTIVEACEFDQYLVKVHGSGRVTKRNRQFLRKFDVRPHFFGPDSQRYSEQEPTSAPTSSSPPGDYLRIRRQELAVDPSDTISIPRTPIILPGGKSPAGITPKEISPEKIPPGKLYPEEMSPEKISPGKISTPEKAPEPVPVITSRRSVRTRKLPQRLNDYCLYE